MEYLTQNYPSLRHLYNATELELLNVPGIGQKKARQLRAIFELSKALMGPEDEKPVISSPGDIYDQFKHMALLEYESFVACYLNTKNRIVWHQEISRGTLNTSLVHPREFFSPAVRLKCASVVAIHNHPSGDPTPSREDLDVTKRLVDAGRLLGIELIDHVVIGSGKFVSFREKGLL
jgi:DNA repair protein RadC